MASPQNTSELLTLLEAAQMVNVGQRTLTRWVAQGRAPRPLKIVPGRQGTVRWRRSDLMDWIEDGCKPVMAGGA